MSLESPALIKSKTVWLPKNYQEDCEDSRKESGLVYVRMVPYSELEKAVIADMCDVCCGDGKNPRCMCNGTGKMSQAAYYLREELYKANQKIDELEEETRRGGKYGATR